MKIAVTDACIFIDIIEIQITSLFFGLDLEIHTSYDVYNELYEDQKELLKAYESVNKLKVHNISSEERTQILAEAFPKSLSNNDKTVIYLAKKVEAMVLSSDKAVRNYAKGQAIEYHGMLWIFDRLIELGLIQPNIAIEKLKQLIQVNLLYQNNPELMGEINKRIEKWGEL